MISPNSKILKLARNAKKIDLEKMKAAAVLSNENEIIDLNRRQMRQGISADGSPLSSYKNPDGWYARMKASLSSYLASFPTVDLFLTGTYQKAMKMTLKAKTVDINSTDSKAGKLDRYNALGLSPDSTKQAQIPVTNTLIKTVSTALRK